MMIAYSVAAVTAYLLGSIPFGFLLVLAFRKEDIRKRGSGNIGATNVLRSGSRWLGTLTLLLDAGKGYAAVSLVRLAVAHYSGAHSSGSSSEASDAAAIAAIFAVLGHVFPIWLRGKGGKGVATALGVFLALAPLAAWCALGTFLAVVFLSRYVSLASIVSAASFPLYAWLWGRVLSLSSWNWGLLASSLVVPAIILVKHAANIDRLLHGKEYRFGSKGSAAA